MNTSIKIDFSKPVTPLKRLYVNNCLSEKFRKNKWTAFCLSPLNFNDCNITPHLYDSNYKEVNIKKFVKLYHNNTLKIYILFN